MSDPKPEYTFKEVMRLGKVAASEWSKVLQAQNAPGARDGIVDVRDYDRANARYEAYLNGWEAQEEAKLTGAPVLGGADTQEGDKYGNAQAKAQNSHGAVQEVHPTD